MKQVKGLGFWLCTPVDAGHGEVFLHAITLDEYGVWDWLLSCAREN